MLPDKTSQHIGTATELTCLIPIKAGFIPVLDTRTYATRLRLVFKTLQALRVASRELRGRRPIVDIVDAAGTVHAFTWAVVDDDRHLLLNVVFDRPWEPYIRVVWKDLGPLLDLFLCNCKDFVSSDQGFDRFAAYVRQHQVNVGFFYPASSLTVADQRYLTRFERLHRETASGGSFDRAAASLVAPGAAETAGQDRRADPREAVGQWLTVLRVLYDLRSLYPEHTDDHRYLHNAARALLETSRPALGSLATPEIAWLDAAPGPPAAPASRPIDADQIQGGILQDYRRVSHGCLLLARIEDPASARAFIGRLVSAVTRASDPDSTMTDERLNVAFTYNGLRTLGATATDLARLPKEFREGMDARAGLLGDVRQNHPDHWTLPEWNVDVTANDTGGVDVGFTGSLAPQDRSRPAPPRPPVRMSTVDVVITLRKVRAWSEALGGEWTPAHPLYSRVVEICSEAAGSGVTVLSVHPLRRFGRKRTDEEKAAGKGACAFDHFGFRDGISQPIPTDTPAGRHDVPYGEIIVGFQNQRGDPPFPPSGDAAAQSRQGHVPWTQGALIDNGSFLVVRKLRQHVAALHAAVERAAGALAIDKEEVFAKMMGRRRDGAPLTLLDPCLAPGVAENDFDFGADPAGTQCPFHAHIRRANPRPPVRSGRPAPVVPRIQRCGLAYGPPFDEAAPDDRDRGLMFMAYNASIAEQFEIVQRWVMGGNTPQEDGGTGVFSGQPDPLLGLPEPGAARTYRFVAGDGRVCHIDLGDEPFVTLEWGLYLFAPSIPALESLAGDPRPDPLGAQRVIEAGRAAMGRLQTLDDWAAATEDLSAVQGGVTAAIHAAIRHVHGGVLRTPYGVIVASHDLGMYVLRRDDLFSVCEYQRRFGRSVGEGYLGMDSGPEYRAVSTPANGTLLALTERDAFGRAHAVASRVLREVIARSAADAAGLAALPTTSPRPDRSIPLPLEPVVDRLLALLAQEWFDIPDGDLIKVGGRPPATRGREAAGDQATDEETLHCPFHFLAPSRYVFSSPHPRDEVRAIGEGHGQRLLEAVRTFVGRRRADTPGPALHGVVSRALFAAIPDDDLLSRTLLGMVFGFVPTVYGNALQVLARWLSDETFWRVQQRLLAAPQAQAYERARAEVRPALRRAMMSLPVPPQIYRTARTASRLGDVDLLPGDRVVVALSSMTQELLAEGRPPAVGAGIATVFGGERGAADAPPHACPGYDIAMGVLVGLLTAVLEVGTVTPTPAPVTVRVTPEPPPGGGRFAPPDLTSPTRA